MTATIIPFPARARPSHRHEEDFISTFKLGLEETRRLNREFNLIGPEWLEILDLMKGGVSRADAASIVVARR